MIILVIVFLLVLFVFIFMNQAKFGKKPVGDALERMQLSKNFGEGMFQNISVTPQLTDGATYYSVMKKFFFQRSKRLKPKGLIPSHKTDLKTIAIDKNVLVWFGHSSYFIQINGKKILVDPVLSGAASPIKSTTKSFPGSDVYSTDDFPEIDYLFLSHDHWDHLDYETVNALKPKVGKVICGLGVGEHLKLWGYNPDIVIENDWDQHILLDKGFEVNTVASRHFSGRGFKRNQSLWLSFALTTPTFKIFIGGDSGYDTHFAKAGNDFGPFDLAILECGQYDRSWKYIHMLPPEILQAVKDLGAKRLLPVHWGKFALANHDWDTPIKELSMLNAIDNIPLLTPMIGEVINLDDHQQFFSKWWESVE